MSVDVTSSIKLFPYQREAQVALDKAFARGIKKALISIPTGGGKTITVLDYFARLLRYYASRGRKEQALWVVHREELVEQALEAWGKVAYDMTASVWGASKKNATGDLVIAMVLSCKKLTGRFAVVGIDEAHHAAVADDDDDDYIGNSYTRLLQRIRWGRVVGCSATLMRLDKRSLDFDEVVYSKSMLDLVKIGRLARPIYIECETNDKYDLKTKGGEYTAQSLTKLDNPKRNAYIVDVWMRNRERFGKTILYVTGVQHCYNMMDEFRKADPNLEIGLVTGECDKKYRTALTEWFADGDWRSQKVLINCAVLTEGFDEPSVNTIMLGRPTASEGLWLQCAGRGARIVYDNILVAPGSWQELEDVGGDGVKRLRLEDGQEVVGEDLGVAGHEGLHRLRVQRHNEFHIVNIMDDITKYAALCADWQATIRELEPEEIEAIKERELLQEQRLRIQKIEDEHKVEYVEPEYLREQLRDVVGILRIATFYTKRMGFPIDIDRYKALKRLTTYADGCWSVVDNKIHNQDGSVTVEGDVHQFDKQKFEEAFVHCCTRGEFAWKWWEKIRVAWYLRYVVNRESVVCQEDSTMYPTWEYISVVDMTADSRRQVVAEALQEFEEAKKANEAFNLEYKDPAKARDLFDQIVRGTIQRLQAVEDQKRRRANNRLIHSYMGNLDLDTVFDRKVHVFMDRSIEGPRQAGEMSRIRDSLSITMREILDDPSCLVLLRPKAFNYSDNQ